MLVKVMRRIRGVGAGVGDVVDASGWKWRRRLMEQGYIALVESSAAPGRADTDAGSAADVPPMTDAAAAMVSGLGIDAALIAPSGAGGRIIEPDVKAFLAAQHESAE